MAMVLFFTPAFLFIGTSFLCIVIMFLVGSWCLYVIHPDSFSTPFPLFILPFLHFSVTFLFEKDLSLYFLLTIFYDALYIYFGYLM